MPWHPVKSLAAFGQTQVADGVATELPLRESQFKAWQLGASRPANASVCKAFQTITQPSHTAKSRLLTGLDTRLSATQWQCQLWRGSEKE